MPVHQQPRIGKNGCASVARRLIGRVNAGVCVPVQHAPRGPSVERLGFGVRGSVTYGRSAGFTNIMLSY